MMPNRERLSVAIVLATILVGYRAHPLEAQAGRDDLRQGINAFFTDLNYDRALPLLLRGVNPLLGPQDSLWAVGVQYLANMVFAENDDTSAIQVWANWAYRHGENVVIDSDFLFPETVTAFSAAAAATSADRDDSTKVTNWVWSGNPSIDQGGFLEVRANVAATITVAGERAFAAGAQVPLATGTYAMTAELAGYEPITLTREILPGARTIVTLQLTRFVTVDDAVSSVGMLTISRYGIVPDSCAAGVFASSNGLLVTTYSAIRGGDDATIRLPGGQVVTAGIQVAAHDVERNVAILHVPNVQTDSLRFATAIDPNQETAVIGFPSCGAVDVERLAVASVRGDPTEVVVLERASRTGHQGGPLVAPGVVLGVSAGGNAVVPAARFAALLQSARSNVASGQLQTLGQVAYAQNHELGAVAVQSSDPGSVLITTTEASQWASLRDSAATPHVFVGPGGTYAYTFYADGEVAKTGEFFVQSGTTTPFEVKVGGGFPLWALLGGAAAGVGALLLLITGPTEPPTTGTTTIIITLP